ncbi:hypothetical protein AVEN_1786-1, partial [Araneus ventricosus]
MRECSSAVSRNMIRWSYRIYYIEQRGLSFRPNSAEAFDQKMVLQSA